jgi:Fur family transcriptional regulator, ferric uptake regulator
MSSPATIAWTGHALQALRGAGYRTGGARRRVVELLGAESCALTALEIDRRLEGVGRATVYRTLEQLAELGLVQRLDVGGEAAGFERVDPDGHHHHHIVCERCGEVVPFADSKLERAIEAVSRAAEFEVTGHEVVLRGTCGRCGRRSR